MGKYLPYILGTWNATVTLEESLTICYEVLLVTQLFLTLWDPMDWSLPGSSVRGVFQARILGWVAISFSGRGIFLTHLLWNYISITIQFSSCTFGHLSSVHFNSVTLSCPTLCDPMDCSTPDSLSITKSQSLLKLKSIELMMPSNHLILCHPLLLPPSIFSSIRVFSNESVLHIRLPKYWNFSFNISPSNEYSGLISFRMDWLDLLAVQGTLKSLLQHHSSEASILQCSAFFIVHSHIHTRLLEKP